MATSTQKVRACQTKGGDSSYVDSTMVALLHRSDNPWVRSNILEAKVCKLWEGTKNIKRRQIGQAVQQVLLKMSKKMQEGQMFQVVRCNPLRQLFKDFDFAYKQIYPRHTVLDWSNYMFDPLDVSNTLTLIMKITEDVTVKIETKSTMRTERQLFTTPFIDVNTLMNHRIVFFDKHVPRHADVYGASPSHTSIEDAQFLQVNVARNFQDKTKVFTPVLPTEKLIIGYRKLKCISILFHKGEKPIGGHYMCAYLSQRDGKWYLYDNLASFSQFLGEFEQMLRWKDHFIPKNLTNVFYSTLDG